MRRSVMGASVLAMAASLAAGDVPRRFGRFGDLHVIVPTSAASRESASRAVVVLSGDAGWDAAAARVATAVADDHTIVIGVDGARFLRTLVASNDDCLYPVTDVESLSQAVQSAVGVKAPFSPALVGIGAGAALAYTLLAQSPPDTFAGGVGMNFCPELRADKPFCHGHDFSASRGKDAWRFAAAKRLEDPWVVMVSSQPGCPADRLEAFMKNVVHGDMLADSSDGKALRDVLDRFVAPPGSATPSLAGVSDLPLVVLPTTADPSKPLAIIVSGDGGWAAIDRAIATEFVRQGVPVVGLNSMKYFWKRKTPDEAGEALDRILSAYLAAWRRTGAVLIGYSRGADVLPFMVRRLPPPQKEKVKLLALLGLEPAIEFEIHVSALWDGSIASRARPVRPEIETLKGMKIACFYGKDEGDSLCPALPDDLAEKIELNGGHHFGGDYQGLVKKILERMPK